MRFYGNWCGPNWTGGQDISAQEYEKRGGDWNFPAVDPLDAACRAHDKSCSGPRGCSTAGDKELIKAAELRIIPFWDRWRYSRERVNESDHAELLVLAMRLYGVIN